MCGCNGKKPTKDEGVQVAPRVFLHVADKPRRKVKDCIPDGEAPCPACGGSGMAKDVTDSAFSELAAKLSHEKGVSDPNAVAAAIGIKKYGAAEMARRSAAARAK